MKTKISICCVALLLFLMSCSSEENEIPADILPMETMTEAYIHLHLLESLITSKKGKSDTSRSEYKYYESQVLLKHNIDPDAFARSKVYYNNNPERLNKVYEAVVDSLGVRERTMEIK